MRLLPLAAVVAALLVPAAPAFAGDPIMPLSQVHAGMQCTGYSVIQGTQISSFDVQVLDVAGGEGVVGSGRILIGVSGPAVDATGLGPGFSGSPIYCPDAAGVSRNIGAVSQSVNEYGGKVALATPIEDILGTPIDVPGKPASATMKAAIARAKPLASPLTVSGLSEPVASALTAAGAKQGRPILAVPAGPLGTFAPQVLRPGSAVAVGYSTGDVRTSAVGTVAYVDGDRIWVFGHSLEGVGRRALLLQDAYIFRIINNPNQLGQIGATYKLGASGHDLGTVTSDGFSAVAGRIGPLPHTVPVHVLARDEDSKNVQAVDTRAADEAAVDLPSGGSWTSFVAPLAVMQAAGVLGSTPVRLTGEMCVRIGIAELRKPMRFCNRYVSVSAVQADDGSTGNAVTSGAAADLGGALSAIDAYTGKPPRVTGVSVLLKLHRGADQAFIRGISLPARVRPGQRVRVRVALQRVRGGALSRTYTIRIPADAKRGKQRLRLTGQDADQGDSGFTTIILGGDTPQDTGGDAGPGTLGELAAAVSATARYDGVSLRLGRAQAEAFRDNDFRISGQADTTVRVIRRR
jgi:hypothetical protein